MWLSLVDGRDDTEGDGEDPRPKAGVGGGGERRISRVGMLLFGIDGCAHV